MSKKHETHSDKKYHVPDHTSHAEKVAKNFFTWLGSHRKLILLVFLGIVVISAAVITLRVIQTTKKNKIVTAFYQANRDFAEKIQKRLFDENALGTTMKALRNITEMSSSVEESLMARYSLGLLHYNIAREQNKTNHYFQARNYWLEVAKHKSFAFAPQSLLAIGSAYEELNKPNFYTRAIEFYDTVIRQYPTTIFEFRALYKKGLAYIKLNKKDLALATLKKIPRYIAGEETAKRENFYYTLAQYYVIMLESQSS